MNADTNHVTTGLAAMDSSVDVLHLGSFAQVFVGELARRLAIISNVRSTSLGMNYLEGLPREAAQRCFSRIIEMPHAVDCKWENCTWRRVLREWLRAPSSLDVREFAAEVLAHQMENKRFRGAARIARHTYLSSWANARNIRPLLNGYQLYHYHSIFPHQLYLMKLLPPSAKVLLTVWGSDLLRVSGMESYRRQLRALKRADLITLQSLEMGEYVLCKFGRQLEHKLRYVSYGNDILDTIEEVDPAPLRTEFCRFHGIDQGNRIVGVGKMHSVQLYAQVMQQIASLDPSYLSNMTVVIPITYNKNESFIASVREMAAQTGLDYRILDRFLQTPQEVAALRSASDIFLQVPSSDALSGAMCEAILAGSVAIAGAWLPYGRLRRAGVRMQEVASIEELPAKLRYVVDNYDQERRLSGESAAGVKPILSWDAVIKTWLECYQELQPSVSACSACAIEPYAPA